jgi:hypothetical protein
MKKKKEKTTKKHEVNTSGPYALLSLLLNMFYIKFHVYISNTFRGMVLAN